MFKKRFVEWKDLANLLFCHVVVRMDLGGWALKNSKVLPPGISLGCCETKIVLFASGISAREVLPIVYTRMG